MKKELKRIGFSESTVNSDILIKDSIHNNCGFLYWNKNFYVIMTWLMLKNCKNLETLNLCIANPVNKFIETEDVKQIRSYIRTVTNELKKLK